MLRGLCDYHIGENISQIKLDLERYFNQLEQMGVKALTFLTKDALGTSYYPTEIGHRNRHINYDLVGAAAKQAKRRGIQFIAYYNGSLDDRLDQEHPDWRQVDSNGKAPYVLNQYTGFCMNTPYRDRVRGQLLELAQNQDISGIWLDITYIFEGRCYCEQCRKKYRQRYGCALPENPMPGSEALLQLKAFRRDCRQEFLHDFAQAVRDIRGPEFSVGWNHAGCIEFCQPQADTQASYFSVEFHAPNYDWPFLQTAWMRPFGKKIELMMSECLYGWGQWTALPMETFKTMGAIALATGSELCLGHIPVPSGPYAGALAQPVVERAAALNKWLAPRQKICHGAVSAANAAIISPSADQYLYAAKNNNWLEGPTPATIGAQRMLMELHQPTNLICEQTLGKLSQYEMVLVPGTAYLPPEMIESLEGYVEQGGLLVVDGAAGAIDKKGRTLEDFSIAHLTGTHLDESTGLTCRYFDRFSEDIINDIPAMPVLVQSEAPMSDVKLESDVKVLAYFTDPEYEAKPRRHIYHQHGHPAVLTDKPAITHRAIGKGNVVHISAPLSEDYHTHGNPALRKILGNIIDTFAPQRRLRVTAPPSVRLGLQHKEKQTLIHLLHYHQNFTTQGPSFIESELPIEGIHLSLRGKKPLRVSQVGEGSTVLPFDDHDGRVEIDIKPLRTHAVVVIES